MKSSTCYTIPHFNSCPSEGYAPTCYMYVCITGDHCLPVLPLRPLCSYAPPTSFLFFFCFLNTPSLQNFCIQPINIVGKKIDINSLLIHYQASLAILQGQISTATCYSICTTHTHTHTHTHTMHTMHACTHTHTQCTHARTHCPVGSHYKMRSFATHLIYKLPANNKIT